MKETTAIIGLLAMLWGSYYIINELGWGVFCALMAILTANNISQRKS
jgi:hypothetical protein